MYPDCCPQMTGVVLSIGLPSWPWQSAQTSTFSAMLCASAGSALAPNNAPRMTLQEVNPIYLLPIDFIPVRFDRSGAATGPALEITT